MKGDMVDSATLWLVLGISGSVIVLLLGAVAFFIGKVIGDVKKAIEETGKNKGKIELVEQQQQNDIKRVEQMTQMELKIMAEKVNMMSDKVSELAESIKVLIFGGGLDSKK